MDRNEVGAEGDGSEVGGGPLAIEDGEDEFLAPLALEDLGLAEVGLLAHAEAAEEGCRGVVSGVGAGEDAVGAEVGEGEVDEGPGRLGRVALAGRVGVEDVAELDLMMVDAPQAKGQVAEQEAIGAADGGEAQHVVVALEAGRRDLLRQGLMRLLAGARLLIEEAGDLGP